METLKQSGDNCSSGPVTKRADDSMPAEMSVDDGVGDEKDSCGSWLRARCRFAASQPKTAEEKLALFCVPPVLGLAAAAVLLWAMVHDNLQFFAVEADASVIAGLGVLLVPAGIVIACTPCFFGCRKLSGDFPTGIPAKELDIMFGLTLGFGMFFLFPFFVTLFESGLGSMVASSGQFEGVLADSGRLLGSSSSLKYHSWFKWTDVGNIGGGNASGSPGSDPSEVFAGSVNGVLICVAPLWNDAHDRFVLAVRWGPEQGLAPPEAEGAPAVAYNASGSQEIPPEDGGTEGGGTKIDFYTGDQPQRGYCVNLTTLMNPRGVPKNDVETGWSLTEPTNTSAVFSSVGSALFDRNQYLGTTCEVPEDTPDGQEPPPCRDVPMWRTAALLRSGSSALWDFAVKNGSVSATVAAQAVLHEAEDGLVMVVVAPEEFLSQVAYGGFILAMVSFFFGFLPALGLPCYAYDKIAKERGWRRCKGGGGCPEGGSGGGGGGGGRGGGGGSSDSGHSAGSYGGDWG